MQELWDDGGYTKVQDTSLATGKVGGMIGFYGRRPSLSNIETLKGKLKLPWELQ